MKTDSFAGQGVVITGACGIYGTWIAAAFAHAGARLCLADRDPAALKATLAELSPAPGSFTVPGDLTTDADLAALSARLGEEWGAPDILVNNAGVYPSGFLLDIDAAEWDRIMDLNVRTPFLLTQQIAKLMIAQQRPGVVINISSGAARKMRRSVVPYCLSKTALDRLTKGYALELAEYGIRVNAVEPGFAAGSTSSPLTEAHVKATVAGIPLGRASNAEDAANAVLFLCSPAASYITGTSIAVDGGNSIGTLTVHQDKKTAL
ncbi:SDR family NAD(P)-dependent oxidoreductase [Acidisphaera sp. L21]|uniref:SDR family NAD(P)-dependent oxidoreductase n=1 Tax=Acidisphaera sp. L21 TaxID=1641851 RepID=UPI00131BAE29|nr:SDR family oxidoreductase [Acidisphaera sp. L21]